MAKELDGDPPWQMTATGLPASKVMIEAGVVRGRTLTSWPSLQTDYRNAGASWVDQELMVCTAGPNTLISSRKPDDLPAFNRAIIEHFSKVKV